MWIYIKNYFEFTSLTILLYAEYENAARQKIMLAFLWQTQITEFSGFFIKQKCTKMSLKTWNKKRPRLLQRKYMLENFD